MPPFARPPVVEFRSLLSPPVQIPLRALYALYRPQCLLSRQPAARSPPCIAQRRNLTLYKTARATTTLGQHKILPFDPYKPPPIEDATDHLINIVKQDRTVVENISLKEAYDKHVKPGQLLYLTQDIPKKVTQSFEKLQGEKWHLTARTYALLTAESIPHNIKPAHSGKGKGALRMIPLTISAPEHFKYSLDRAYQFVKHGSPVEFTFRVTGKHIKDKLKRLLPSDDLTQMEWIQTHFPHVRPDFILRSMPEGAVYIVDPVSNGYRVQFVVGLPRVKSATGNLTKRLFNVKEAVELSIERGLQGELPKAWREKLAESGSKAYSPMTGKPLEVMDFEEEDVEDSEEQAPQEQSEVDYESLTSKDRYMPIRTKAKPQKRTDKLTTSGKLDRPQWGRQYIKPKQLAKMKRFGEMRIEALEEERSSKNPFRREFAGHQRGAVKKVMHKPRVDFQNKVADE